MRELNCGWLEWVEAGLPVHGDRELPSGEVHCECSLDADASEEAAAR